MKLYIGNKNYSSWSLRPWLVLKVFQIPFDEQWIAFDDFSDEGQFKQTLKRIHPTAKVPLLQDDEIVVADSLAICEYLAERFASKQLWPQDLYQRTRARSICAEMHAGFQALRQFFPMNVEADLTVVGQELWRQQGSDSALQRDVQRIEQIWAQRPQADGFLCGSAFSIADAFFAPVVLRFQSYKPELSASSEQYMQKILALTELQAWQQAARAERCFVAVDEPYRQNSSI